MKDFEFDEVEEVHKDTPFCPAGHGNMIPVRNDYGYLMHHRCKACSLTDKYDICSSCNEEPVVENRLCKFCLLDLIDDYSEYL